MSKEMEMLIYGQMYMMLIIIEGKWLSLENCVVFGNFIK